MDPHPAAPPGSTAKADDEQLLASARRALSIEARAVEALTPRLGPEFAHACRICLACRGRVVVTGMGKSGHVAGKIAATLASTGTPAFFLHPAEAGHGDLGMITRLDAVLALSNSGETPEVVQLLPHLKRLAVPLIVMCGRADSTLARAANVTLDVSVPEEACPLNLAPTASTTATLAMGDALAVVLAVGARLRGHASSGTLTSSVTLAARARVESARPHITMSGTARRFRWGSNCTTSGVSPELDSASTASTRVIIPRSP